MSTSSDPADGPPPNSASPLDTVGQKLRKARLAAGMSVREMARRVDVSPSFISQVELGRTKPSVGTLYAIATEMGVPLDDLMPVDSTASSGPPAQGLKLIQKEAGRPSVPDQRDTEPGSPLQRGDRRHELRMDKAVWGRLTSDHDPENDFLHVVYAPGGESCPEDSLIHHPGVEYGYVISGGLHVQVGFTHYELNAGDSIRFESMTPHRLHNPFDVESVSIWIVVGRGGTPVL
ncbi:DNA-binding protein [Actinomadura sp. NBRC 104412]|uniref:helix-turn-helix domain-containing protein n=1 Tax=Actinomadura sp. NBRC 104412 TaxID=3032203 RepID=UPI0024A4C329|nr:XRE family transcriptional regulator [Actinomadura sp. NBRC 104412]GLZ06621.1 DNA-binding protein [Actinomadura sp. NBRC 104412]